jgi:predicted glycosyltransferase
VPRVLVATGGGGTTETAQRLYQTIDAVIAAVRQKGAPFEVVQAIGPRARHFGRLAQADRTLDPGGALNELFCDADVVISTAGYNSVLELATTDTPTLLVPIPRSIDDQERRARAWAKHLGMWLDPTSPGASAAWLGQAVVAPRRRPPVDLGPSGEDRAARAILELG